MTKTATSDIAGGECDEQPETRLIFSGFSPPELPSQAAQTRSAVGFTGATTLHPAGSSLQAREPDEGPSLRITFSSSGIKRFPNKLSDTLTLNLITVECVFKDTECEPLAGLRFTSGSALQNQAALHYIIESASQFRWMGRIGNRPVHRCLALGSLRFCFSFHRNLRPAAVGMTIRGENPSIERLDPPGLTLLCGKPSPPWMNNSTAVTVPVPCPTILPIHTHTFTVSSAGFGPPETDTTIPPLQTREAHVLSDATPPPPPPPSLLTHVFPHAEGIWIVFCNFKPAMISRPSGRRQAPSDSLRSI